ncbi:hypothetical protein [Xanthomonas fragariae]|uniref:hypothetical protein n=1 Tax=Xanthomonas fragariae TaxID=48664 RepID=UPI00131EF8C3|nr:hypothetical protein [Xanthomonas fragariae]MEA5251001.1 hypothetical protein [Xanthomonas fragariae]
MSARLVTDDQANALGELYAWDCVVSILEGSTAPRRKSGQTAASRVIAIAKAEQQKLKGWRVWFYAHSSSVEG